MEKDSKFKIDKKIFEYTHINFFVGAGIHAKLIGLFDGFCETIKLIKNNNDEIFIKKIEKEKERLISLGEKNPLSLDGVNVDLESYFSLLIDTENQDKIMDCFYLELKNKNDSIFDSKEKKDSYDELKLFVDITNMLINERETNVFSMKTINYFTLNYDSVINNLMSDSSEDWNIFKPINIFSKSKIIDQLSFDENGKDSKIRWNIFKLHGDVDDKKKIIFPSKNKYFTANYGEFFELIFSMRRKLSQKNSILIILGYSVKDDHINAILNEVNKNGVLILFFGYSKNDCDIFKGKFKQIDDKFIINTNGKSSISFYNEMVKNILGEKWTDEENE